MKYALLVLVLSLAACTSTGALSPQLTDAAKQACASQSVLNTLAGVGAFLGPQVAAGAAAASAVVGVACTWVN